MLQIRAHFPNYSFFASEAMVRDIDMNPCALESWGLDFPTHKNSWPYDVTFSEFSKSRHFQKDILKQRWYWHKSLSMWKLRPWTSNQSFFQEKIKANSKRSKVKQKCTTDRCAQPNGLLAVHSFASRMFHLCWICWSTFSRKTEIKENSVKKIRLTSQGI